MPRRTRTLLASLGGLTAALLTASLLPAGPAATFAVAATPSAERGPGAACPTDASRPLRQVRGEWIASVVNIDWPSRPGLSAAQQRAELVGWYDEAVERGLNTVVLQVRPTADTFWPSELEPWSRYLTGTPGGDPGYDPLAFAVDAAHERGLELHAWFNPYRVAMDTNRAALPAGSPAAEHPEWVREYGGKLYYDPGVPQVRELTTDVILEVVRRYDVDGIHFDDYFYPYPVAGQEFPDDATFAAHGAGFPDTPEGRADWRRHNTDLLIAGLDRRIHAIAPHVLFGVSPFAVWRNRATDPAGSATTAGAETYDDLYADTRRWVREEWVDYIAPQVYWNIGFAAADYAALVPWWADVVRGTDVQLHIGQATYKQGVEPAQSPAWLDPREMSRHLSFNQDHPEVVGDLYFSAKDVRANRLGHMDVVQSEHYSRPALLPVTAGVPGRATRPVGRLQARDTRDGVDLRWRAVPGAERYAVYRVPGRRVERCDLADATHLVGVVTQPAFRDARGPRSTGRATYVVTALDEAHRQSTPRGVRVRP